MAIKRVTAEAAKASAQIDPAKFDAITDEDIRRFQIEDGFDPDSPMGEATLVVPAALVRHKLGLSQSRFAALIRVPLRTVQHWEHGRVPDPAARTLLLLLWREPDVARRALAA